MRRNQGADRPEPSGSASSCKQNTHSSTLFADSQQIKISEPNGGHCRPWAGPGR
jgi:hypothetical protein